MMRLAMMATLLAGAMIAAPPGAAQSGGVPVVRASPDPAPALPDTPIIPVAPGQERLARAIANLEALRQGRLFTSDLTPLELQDVLELDRTARSGALGDNRSFAQQCIDEEVRRNGGRPSRLAWEVIRLKCR
jgi:hypothetical protein